MDGWGDGPLPVELNVARRSTGRRRVPARRVDVLEPPDVVDGLPVTGIGQTLVELGSTITADVLAPVDRVELAVECALHRRLIGLTGVEDVLARGSARCGAAVLRAVLARRPHGAPPTESWLETRMVQLLRDGGLPDPQRQVELRDSDAFIGRVDLLLDALVVELHAPSTTTVRRWTPTGSVEPVWRPPATGCSSSATGRWCSSRCTWWRWCGPRSTGSVDGARRARGNGEGDPSARRRDTSLSPGPCAAVTDRAYTHHEHK
ncbi:MAG: hypothetical protein R2755_15650 [Acidimicrobiales bacterium]